MAKKKTKVVNVTGSSISLQVGTANVYRTLCSDLQHGKSHTLKLDEIATYREYKVAVPLDDDKYLVLSSDDCMEYEEVHIKLKGDKTTYTWDAFKRHSRELVKDAGDKEVSNRVSNPHPTPAITSSVTAGPNPGIVGKFMNIFRGWSS